MPAAALAHLFSCLACCPYGPAEKNGACLPLSLRLSLSLSRLSGGKIRGKEPKHKVFGRDIPGTSGTQTSGCPGQKLYASGLFLLFETRSGRDVPGFGLGRPGFGKTLPPVFQSLHPDSKFSN